MIDVSTYLGKATDILFDYQWVYNFRATHLLVNDTLTHIPNNWIKALLGLTDDDLSLLTSGIVKDGWPACLSDFVHRCHELTLPHAAVGSFSQSKGWDYIPAELQKGMSPKKQHEVLHLTSFIYHQCYESNLSRILDLGSGLGHLGKLLHHRSGYRVLGLEANEGCVGRAVSMQQPICSLGVKHVALTLRPAHKEHVWRTTVDQVRGVLETRENWEGRCSCGGGGDDGMAGGAASDSSICMVSLHSCGDLSPTALRLFLELPQARRLVLMSCCFHKMKSTQGGGGWSRRRCGRGSEGGEEEAVVVCDGSLGHPEASPLRVSAAPEEVSPACGEDDELFPDFPMSSQLGRLVCERRSFVRRPLLRLASEMTVEMWRLMTAKQRNEHSVHVLGRAVFELYAKRERYKLKKMRRRGVRKSQRSNFDDYFEDALQRFEFTPLPPPPAHPPPPPCGDRRAPPEATGPLGVAGDLCDIPYIDEDDAPVWGEGRPGPSALRPGAPLPGDATPLEVHRLKLKALTEEQCTPEALRLTTALYALQAAIQSIAEGLVIADRLAFLLEQGGCSIEASLVRVFDRSLSPRSLAIVARKGDPLVDVNSK